MAESCPVQLSVRTLARDTSGDNGGIEGQKAQGESKMRDQHFLERLLKSPETVMVEVLKLLITK